MDKICIQCGKKFIGDSRRKYCSRTCSANYLLDNKISGFDRVNESKRNLRSCLEVEYNKNPVKCKICGIKLNFNKRLQDFCSISCSNKSRKQSVETREKIRKSLQKELKKCICAVCGKEFEIDEGKRRECCSRHCAMKLRHLRNPEFWIELGKRSGKIAAQSQNRRSKNEILFAEMCNFYFENVLTNAPMFDGWDADVILPDLKLAIMWNGKWHYEKLAEKHSVSQVQNRDRLKIEKIKAEGYTPYIIKDMGGENKDFVKQEFDKMLEYIKNRGDWVQIPPPQLNHT